MNYTKSEVLQFVEENDVKMIRLMFCDIFGTMKTITVMPGQLGHAFDYGISFDASAVRGFLDVTESDLLLVPDPSTLSILPWRPSSGRIMRFFCHIRYPDGRPFEGDSRWLLSRTAERGRKRGLSFQIGPECEFYLFLTDEQGYPALTPHDRAGYCDVAPHDRGENIRRDICLSLEEMGILPESSHHEQGTGQNEIDFHHAPPLEAADNLMAFRSVVKAAASQNGLYASFLPKPLENQSGSGLHINLSMYRDETNQFEGLASRRPAPEAESFTQGILRRSAELAAFLNPLPNSYLRLGRCEAPSVISWSHQNRSQLVRVPAAQGDYSRIEIRSPDPACNPYIAIALLLEAGMEGIDEKLPLEPAFDHDTYRAAAEELAGMRRLPETLRQALALAEGSAFLRGVLPGSLMENYLSLKRREWQDYEQAADKYAYEIQRYFHRI